MKDIKKNIIIATIKEWNIENYFKLKQTFSNKYNFHLITSKEELTEFLVQKLDPKYIFFLHWSWIIPKEVYKNFECVVFHMTDLPFGRGGSPLQNLLIKGIYQTKISAIKVSETVDAGDIYLKEDLDISTGSAKEIFTKASKLTIEKMIPQFLNTTLTPKKQSGKVVTFKRRKPYQSNLASLENISIPKLYDFIRMLDADGYPKAFMELDKYKIEFSSIQKENDTLSGKFKVVINE